MTPKLVLETPKYRYYEVAPGVFNTDPRATGGYARLDALRRLKGDI